MKLPKESRDKREHQSNTGRDIQQETGNAESVCVCNHDTVFFLSVFVHVS